MKQIKLFFCFLIFFSIINCSEMRQITANKIGDKKINYALSSYSTDFFIICNDDGEIVIVNLENNIVEKKLKIVNEPIITSELSRNGKYLALSTASSILLYDFINLSLISKLNIENGIVIALSFSNDSEYLFAGGSDEVINCFKIPDFTLKYTKPLAHKRILDFCMDDDDKYILTYYIAGPRHNWGVDIFEFPSFNEAASIRYPTELWDFCYKDERFFCSGFNDYSIDIIDMKNLQIKKYWNGNLGNPVNCVFSNDKELFASLQSDNSILIGKIDDGSPIKKIKSPTDIPLTYISFNYNDKKLIAFDYKNNLFIWNL